MTTICPVCESAVESDAAACPQCGFRLLGTTQQFRPLTPDLLEQGRPDEKRRGWLCVLRGPQSGLRFQLGDEPLTIGRSPECGIFLNDMTVSREHACIHPVANGYVITDQNSFNGVWVNNTSIDSRRLAPNDIIQIGAFLLMYEES